MPRPTTWPSPAIGSTAAARSSPRWARLPRTRTRAFPLPRLTSTPCRPLMALETPPRNQPRLLPRHQLHLYLAPSLISLPQALLQTQPRSHSLRSMTVGDFLLSMISASTPPPSPGVQLQV